MNKKLEELLSQINKTIGRVEFESIIVNWIKTNEGINDLSQEELADLWYFLCWEFYNVPKRILPFFTKRGISQLPEIPPRKQNHIFTFEFIRQLNNYRDTDGDQTLAHNLVWDRVQFFTFDQIMALGDPIGYDQEKLSIQSVKEGQFFTFDQIKSLHNPEDYYGATLAHWCAKNGQRFSPSEILTLGNPILKTDIHIFYNAHGLVEFNLGTPPVDAYVRGRCIVQEGATIAHIMRREGYEFSPEEIVALGNPLDAAGRSLSDKWRPIDGFDYLEGLPHSDYSRFQE